MSVRPIVTRISLPLTEHLNLGTGRIAVFNYLLARGRGGKVHVRIEDLTHTRLNAPLVEPVLTELRWLGCEWDGDVVYQSQSLDVYQSYGAKLLESGHGFRCFCTTVGLEAGHVQTEEEERVQKTGCACLGMSTGEVEARIARGDACAVRLRVPDGETEHHDMVRGPVIQKNDDTAGFVVVRPDGTPTSDFAAVVDDHAMGVTHILCGDDHLLKTFDQVRLFRAFRWEAPQFGHIPSIGRVDKKTGLERFDTDVAEYRSEDILPEALFNYLCVIGWTTGTGRDFYSKHQLLGLFTPDNFDPSTAHFDEEELVSFNRAHIAMKSDHELAVLVAPLLVESGVTTKYWLETRWVYLRTVISLLKEQASRITDFVSLGGYFFFFNDRYDPKADAELFAPETAELLAALADRYAGLSRFSHETTVAALTSLAEERGVDLAKLIHPTRLAVSGMTVGPDLYGVLEVLSQPVVVERMKKAVDYIRTKHNL